jgi:hypothetical protein
MHKARAHTLHTNAHAHTHGALADLLHFGIHVSHKEIILRWPQHAAPRLRIPQKWIRTNIFDFIAQFMLRYGMKKILCEVKKNNFSDSLCSQ